MTGQRVAERWLTVPGRDGYEVSNLGSVRSWRGRSAKNLPRTLSPRRLPTGSGYLQVHLYADGTLGKNAYVHQLVAAAFIGPRPDGMVVRHLDGDPTNNAAANLAYGTRSENNRDAVRHGTNRKAAQTHCIHGHEFTPANTHVYRGADGTAPPHRTCRECTRIRWREKGSRARADRRQAVSA